MSKFAPKTKLAATAMLITLAMPVYALAEIPTTITSEDIKKINAHTLSDVINTVPGIFGGYREAPGGLDYPLSLGYAGLYYQLVIDGVPYQSIFEGIVDMGAIPVQRIEKIEITKGPGSLSPKAGLGGVINVTTKSPTNQPGGEVLISGGERGTGEARVELSGTRRDLGYYLSLGGLTSDGFTPHSAVDGGNAFGKIVWTPQPGTSVFASYSQQAAERELGAWPELSTSFAGSYNNLAATAGISHQIASYAKADFSGYYSLLESKQKIRMHAAQESMVVEKRRLSQPELGAEGKFSWQFGRHLFVAGADYSNTKGSFKWDNLFAGDTPEVSARQEQAGAFLRNSVSAGKWNIAPEVRYDWLSDSEDFVSGALKVDYQWKDHTAFYGSVSRSFNAPAAGVREGLYLVGYSINEEPETEKALSYQVGVETLAIPSLRLKANLFRHNISDALIFSNAAGEYINTGDQYRQGGEVSIQTRPFYNTSLAAGYMFVDAKGYSISTDGSIVKGKVSGSMRHSANVAVDYDDQKLLRANLSGRYFNTRDNSIYFRTKDTAMIWDLNCGVKLTPFGLDNGEVFFSVHNLFNGTFDFGSTQRNADRWTEGGIRFKF